MDYGRFKYEQSKRDRESRKKQKSAAIKEVRMSPKTDRHDIDVKVKTPNVSCAKATGSRSMSVFAAGRSSTPDLVRDRLMEMARPSPKWVRSSGSLPRGEAYGHHFRSLKRRPGKRRAARKSAAEATDEEVLVNVQAQDA